MTYKNVMCDKNLLYVERTIERFPLCVKEKVTTTYVVLGWIGVLRFFRNRGWRKIGSSNSHMFGNRLSIHILIPDKEQSVFVASRKKIFLFFWAFSVYECQ